MNNKNLKLIIIAVVLIVGAIGLNFFVFFNNNKDTKAEANEVETIYEVVDEVKEGNVVLDEESMAEIEKAKNPSKDTTNVVEESKTVDLNIKEVKKLSLVDKEQKEVNADNFKDKANFIMFFDNSNEDSIEMLDRVNSEYKNYKEKINFVIIDISEETKSDLNSKYDFDIYFDVDNQTKDAYEIKNTPSMIYILEEGEVLNSKSGLTTKDALQANLDILSGNF